MQKEIPSELAMVKEIMIEERLKMKGSIIFPPKLANATYKRLDPKPSAPHLVQFLGHDDLRRIARALLVEQGREEERKREMEQASVEDLDQYQLLPNYPGERCQVCERPEEEHGQRRHEFEGMYCSIPLEECTRHELETDAERLLSEGKAKVKHGKALQAYIQRKFGFNPGPSIQ